MRRTVIVKEAIRMQPLLVVNADTPWKTVKDFLDDVKRRPGEPQ